MGKPNLPGGLPFEILDAQGEWDRVMWWAGFRWGIGASAAVFLCVIVWITT